MSNEETKKKGKVVAIVLAVVAVVAIAVVIILLCARSKMFSASTIRLLSYEGNIVIDTDGKMKSIVEGQKIDSGERLRTGEDSKANVELDEDRVITMMQQASVEFTQEGKKLAVNVKEGQIFFNIARSLEDDETLDVCTSNVRLSIRGTSGYVDADEDGSQVLYLTSGHVYATIVHPVTYVTEHVDVNAGQKLTVTILDDENFDIRVEDIEERDLPKDAILTIVGNNPLIQEIVMQNGWLEETLVAESEPSMPVEKDGYIVFGAYEQDNDLSNGKEPIEWEVVYENDHGAMLISRYVLDARSLIGGGVYTASDMPRWDNSTLRSWLNDDFYKTAFNTSERELLMSEQRYGDKVSLLFLEDVMNYYPSEYDLTDHHTNRTGEEVTFSSPIAVNSNLIVPATEYAKAQWYIPEQRMDGNMGRDIDALTDIVQEPKVPEGYNQVSENSFYEYLTENAGKEGSNWWIISYPESLYGGYYVSYEGVYGLLIEDYITNESCANGDEVCGVRPVIYIKRIGDE